MDFGQRIKDTNKGQRTKASAAASASRGLVLLVQYNDVKFKSASTQSSMNDMLNGTNYTYGGATGSVRQYFSDQSNGVYVPEFGVFGPITLSQNMAYYGQNANNTQGKDLRPAEMVNEACSIANAQFGVDFSQYDSDNDNDVDFVYIIYAGYAEAQGGSANSIWPHAWDLYSAGISSSKRRYDGKYVSRYACSSELRGYSGSTRDGIGTFCHEFSHVLGLPDYYDTEYGTNYNRSATPGTWSLMDQGSYNNNSRTPPNYSAYDKYFLGWATPTILNTPSDVTIAADGQTYYAITADGTLPSATSTKDMWYLENRQQTGWDAYLPAHGMLVTKIRYDNNAWYYNTVNNGTPMYYDIIEADGTASGSGSAGATFPGSDNVTSFTPIGDYALTNITETSGVIQFDFMGGEEDEDDDNDNPTTDGVVFYDSFEDPDAWITSDPSSTAYLADYGGIFINAFSNMSAVGGDYYLISSYDSSAARNAWAISTNSASLKAGQEYTLSVYVFAPGYGGVADQIQFTVGTSSTISSQTQVVLDVHEQYDSWTLVTAKFRPTTDGTYHFGIHHCTQDVDVNNIAIDELTVTTSADEPIDDVLTHEGFEADCDWIITDKSTTTSFKMQIGSIRDVAAVAGDYYLVSGYDASAARNAWAIMRNGVSLKAGKEYTMSAYVYAPGYGVADQIQFTVGTSSAISSQTKVILDVQEKYDSWTLVTAKFTPTTDGTYHFGIHHCTQNKDVNAIAVDEFTVTASADETEPEVIPVTGISLDVLQLQLVVGATKQLTATITPDNATNQNVLWKSFNESIATVENGLVSAFAKGTTTVTVTTEDGNYSAFCIVTVSETTTTALEDVEINASGIQKVFENGTIYIVKPNGEKYNVDGRKVVER